MHFIGKKGTPTILILLLVLLPAMSLADIYIYTDEQGTRHFTNVPSDKRYKLYQPNRHSTRLRESKKSVRRQPVQRRHVALRQIDRHIEQAAYRNQIDPLLIKAVIKTESNFDPAALSSKGAQGLMQLMPGTAKDLRVADPFDAGQNIAGGTRYLRTLLDTFQGDLQLSLAAYNAGPRRVKENGKVPRIPETVAYVNKVLRHYRSYQQQSAQGKSINVGKLVTIN